MIDPRPRLFTLTVQREGPDGMHPVVCEYEDRSEALPRRVEGRFRLDLKHVEALHQATLDPRLGQRGREEAERAYGTYLGQRLLEGSPPSGAAGAAAPRGISPRDLLSHARGDGDGALHICLHIEAEALKPLRWERLCVPTAASGWDFASFNHPFSLYRPSGLLRAVLPLRRSEVRALVVVASPPRGSERPRAFDAAGAVEAAVAGFGDAILWDPATDLLGAPYGRPGAEGAMDATPATLEALCAHLARRRYGILHLVCHGLVMPDGETTLYLHDAQAQAKRHTATDVIERLGRMGGQNALPQMIFLGTCESAVAAQRGVMGGLAERLVELLGIPAVLGMTDKVSVKTATELSRAFYPGLAAGALPSEALMRAFSGERRLDMTVPVVTERLKGRPLFVEPLGEADDPRADLRVIEPLRAAFEDWAPSLMGELEEALARLPATDAPSKPGHDDARLALDALVRQVLGVGWDALARGAAIPRFPGTNPFVGQRAFTQEEASRFFGREDDASAALKHFTSLTAPIMALCGPSGSGKSSLALAGIVPKLRATQPALEVHVLRPGDSPMERLKTVQRALSEAGSGGRQGHLVIVDELDELFTGAAPPSERVPFLEGVLGLARRARVLTTFRAGYWDALAIHPRLQGLLMRQQLQVLPLPMDALRQAIEAQTRGGGMLLEPGLAAALMADIEGEPGAQAIAQRALSHLFDRRRGRTLSLGVYRAQGGARGMLAAAAEAAFGRLDPGEQALAQGIITRLASLASGDPLLGLRHTRRRVAVAQVIPAGSDGATVLRVIDGLADEGVLSLTQDPLTQALEVEVALEDLLSHWPRLRGWLSDDLDRLRLRETLSQATRAYSDAQEAWLPDLESHLIHRGARLSDAKALLGEDSSLTEGERAYVEACLALADRERARETERLRAAEALAEAQRQRAEEAEAARHRLQVQRAEYAANLLLPLAQAVAASNQYPRDGLLLSLLALMLADGTPSSGALRFLSPLWGSRAALGAAGSRPPQPDPASPSETRPYPIVGAGWIGRLTAGAIELTRLADGTSLGVVPLKPEAGNWHAVAEAGRALYLPGALGGEDGARHMIRLAPLSGEQRLERRPPGAVIASCDGGAALLAFTAEGPPCARLSGDPDAPWVALPLPPGPGGPIALNRDGPWIAVQRGATVSIASASDPTQRREARLPDPPGHGGPGPRSQLLAVGAKGKGLLFWCPWPPAGGQAGARTLVYRHSVDHPEDDCAYEIPPGSGAEPDAPLSPVAWLQANDFASLARLSPSPGEMRHLHLGLKAESRQVALRRKLSRGVSSALAPAARASRLAEATPFPLTLGQDLVLYGETMDQEPVWKAGVTELAKRADGVRPEVAIVTIPGGAEPPEPLFSPDGQWLILCIGHHVEALPLTAAASRSWAASLHGGANMLPTDLWRELRNALDPYLYTLVEDVCMSWADARFEGAE